MNRSNRVVGALCCGASLILLLGACGSSDGDEATTDVADAQDSGADAETDTATSETTVADVAADTTVETAPPETAAAGSVVRVSGGSTDPWEIDGYCEWTPDNTGAASSLYVVEDTDDERDEEITILEVWPFNIEDDSETSIIGSIVEPGGSLLSVIDVEPSFDGTNITLLVGVVSGVNFSETPEFTVTVTCNP